MLPWPSLGCNVIGDKMTLRFHFRNSSSNGSHDDYDCIIYNWIQNSWDILFTSHEMSINKAFPLLRGKQEAWIAHWICALVFDADLWSYAVLYYWLIVFSAETLSRIHSWDCVCIESSLGWERNWESEAALERWCMTFDRGMFFIAGSSIFIFSWWLLCCTAFIQTARRCLDSSLHRTKHTQVVWNDIHQSNFVSLRDQVNVTLSLTVIEHSGLTLFSYVDCGDRLFRNASRKLGKPQKTPSSLIFFLKVISGTYYCKKICIHFYYFILNYIS